MLYFLGRSSEIYSDSTTQKTMAHIVNFDPFFTGIFHVFSFLLIHLEFLQDVQLCTLCSSNGIAGCDSCLHQYACYANNVFRVI